MTVSFNQDVILKEIFSLSFTELNKLGFTPNKKLNKYSRVDGEFTFNILFNIGAFGRQHLILTVEHKGISKIFKETIKKTREVINDIPLIKGNRSVISVTDWKFLYEENHIPFSGVWFTSLSSVSDISKLKDDYFLSFSLANKWFEKCKDCNYIYDYSLSKNSSYSIEIALCVGKILGKNIARDLDFILEGNNGPLSADVDLNEVLLFNSILQNTTR